MHRLWFHDCNFSICGHIKRIFWNAFVRPLFRASNIITPHVNYNGVVKAYIIECTDFHVYAVIMYTSLNQADHQTIMCTWLFASLSVTVIVRPCVRMPGSQETNVCVCVILSVCVMVGWLAEQNFLLSRLLSASGFRPEASTKHSSTYLWDNRD